MRQTEKHIKRDLLDMLEYIGEDITRDGLKETPDRIMRSWEELFAGYKQDPESVFKVFENDAQIEGMVYLTNIEFFSTCEHHFLPFSGEAHIAYIPDGPIIGASKLARLLDVYARRLQVQERIGEQVTSALMEHLKPKGAACIIEARHLCMACRGVKKQHSILGYSSMKGSFLTDARSRLEFISLIRRGDHIT
jgi:GTP cyclohydrolase IA